MADPFHEWIMNVDMEEIDDLKQVQTPQGNHNFNANDDRVKQNDAEFEANAMASAMVGETIMDTNAIPPDYRGLSHHSFSFSSLSSEHQQSINNDTYTLGSVGRWWYQRNRRKKCESLQRQIDEQHEILMKESDQFITGLSGSDGEIQDSSTQMTSQPSRRKIIKQEASICEMIGGARYQASSSTYSSTSSLNNLVNDSNHQSNELSKHLLGNSPPVKTKRRRGKKQKDLDLVDRNIIKAAELNNSDGLIKSSSLGQTVSGQGISVQFQISDDETNDREAFAYVSVLAEPNCDVPPLLSIGQMRSIVSQGLPSSLLYSKWKRLYSLQRDGDSFEGAFLPRVLNDTRTVLVIKTTCGSVFGGFADSAWKGTSGNLYASTVTDASFYGSAQACLFACNTNNKDNDDDDCVSVYKWSGANHYCQICDVHNKMIGFGGGGDCGEFGLCVEENFQRGSTGSCETFNNPPLCPNDRFEIMDVECWGFVIGLV